jgi:hypothetical protein
VNPFKLPVIGYLGRFAGGDIPDQPCLFRWDSGLLYSTDGKRRVFGPHYSERDARFQLEMHLLKRRRVCLDVTVYVLCSAAILVLFYWLANAPVLQK